MPPSVPVDEEHLRLCDLRVIRAQFVEQVDVEVCFAERQVRVDVRRGGKVDRAREGRDDLFASRSARPECSLHSSWRTLSSGYESTASTATPSSPAELRKEMSRPATVCSPAAARSSSDSRCTGGASGCKGGNVAVGAAVTAKPTSPSSSKRASDAWRSCSLARERAVSGGAAQQSQDNSSRRPAFHQAFCGCDHGGSRARDACGFDHDQAAFSRSTPL